jgi:hypothetical protein
MIPALSALLLDKNTRNAVLTAAKPALSSG